jgi:hypothetical protein
VRCEPGRPSRRGSDPLSGPRASVAGMRQNEAADIVALEVLRMARERGEAVTIGLTREVMGELSGHESVCCEACEAARKVSLDHVHVVASKWFSVIAAHHR